MSNPQTATPPSRPQKVRGFFVGYGSENGHRFYFKTCEMSLSDFVTYCINRNLDVQNAWLHKNKKEANDRFRAIQKSMQTAPVNCVDYFDWSKEGF